MSYKIDLSKNNVIEKLNIQLSTVENTTARASTLTIAPQLTSI